MDVQQTLLYNNEWKQAAKIFTKEDLARMEKVLKESDKYQKNIYGEWMKARDMLLMKSMYYMLLRPKEACYLRFSDYDKVNHAFFIRPENNKERKGRIVAIPLDLQSYMDRYFLFPAWLWHNSQYLFPS